MKEEKKERFLYRGITYFIYKMSNENKEWYALESNDSIIRIYSDIIDFFIDYPGVFLWNDTRHRENENQSIEEQKEWILSKAKNDIDILYTFYKHIDKHFEEKIKSMRKKIKKFKTEIIKR